MIRADHIMSVAQWREHRRRHASIYVAHRRARTVALGPAMRILFEDATTIRYQIQEVLRAQNASDAASVAHEIQTYAHLLPSRCQWNATLLIELPDACQRKRELPRLNSAVHHIFVEAEGHGRVRASANDDLPDRHLNRPSAVHFLRFDLTMPIRAAVRAGARLVIGCDDDSYPWSQEISAPTLLHLANDLDDGTARDLVRHTLPA